MRCNTASEESTGVAKARETEEVGSEMEIRERRRGVLKYTEK